MSVNMGDNHRAPKGGLSRDRIVEAALELVDSKGLEALSARNLAAHLGCKAMSLYNHIASMDDLLDGIVDRLLASVSRDPKRSDGIAESASAYLALAETHPDAFILVATRVLRGPNARAAAMSFVSYFQSIGCGNREALRRARVLGAYLNGAGLALGAWRRSEKADGKAKKRKAVRKDLEIGLAKLLASLSKPPKRQRGN